MQHHHHHHYHQQAAAAQSSPSDQRYSAADNVNNRTSLGLIVPSLLP